MIGQKLNSRNLAHVFNNVKQHVAAGYHHTKRFFGNVDHGVRTLKEIYRHIEPLIQEYAGDHHAYNINRHVIKGLSHYEKLRHDVIEGDHHVNKIGNVISKLISP